MNKAVMISVRPEWCELIASRIKTVDLRKTKPKLEPPFKCYLYETKANNHYKTFHEKTMGKVIGEFICDKMFPVSITCKDSECKTALREFPFICLTDKHIIEYLGNGCTGYGWHISNLTMYAEPKELSEFSRPCICEDEYDTNTDRDCLSCDLARDNGSEFVACDRRLTKPPQSWYYVEEFATA